MPVLNIVVVPPKDIKTAITEAKPYDVVVVSENNNPDYVERISNAIRREFEKHKDDYDFSKGYAVIFHNRNDRPMVTVSDYADDCIGHIVVSGSEPEPDNLIEVEA
jgi:hypothetical protein